MVNKSGKEPVLRRFMKFLNYKIITRLIGVIVCLRGYYLVLTEKQISVFHTVTVSNWMMYLIPLTTIIIAEGCIISVEDALKRIKKHEKADK